MEEHEHTSFLAELQSHLSFVLVALAIMAGVILLSVVCEKLVMRKAEKPMTIKGTKRISGIGLFAALGGVLTLIEIPLFIFYQLDFSEIPALMAGFLMGPVAGVIVEFIKVFIHVLFHGTHSAFVGEFAMFICGCFLVIPSSVLYWRNKTRGNALIGLITGTLSLVVFGGLFNGFYLIPKFAELYAGADVDAIVAMAQDKIPAIKNVWTMVLFATVPFNAIKGVVMSAITFLIYKPLSILYQKL